MAKGPWSNRVVPTKLADDDAELPEYQNSDDAGADLRAAETSLIEPGERARIATGVRVDLPNDFVAFVWSRSGLSDDHGIEVGAGLIDPGYRGEIDVVLYNHGDEKFAVDIGDRIAQLVIVPFTRAVFAIDEELADSERGIQGFGSTGT